MSNKSRRAIKPNHIRTYKHSHTREVDQLSIALYNNGKASEDGPKKKTWHSRDIKTILPLTATQEDMFHAFYSDLHIVGVGSPGTGKTYISLYLALTDVLDPARLQQKIIIVRSNVSTRELGHLPGTDKEKMAPFEAPYVAILEDLCGKVSTYEDMKSAGVIEFVPTSFVRGMTWSNTIVIVDEVQSLNLHEIDSVVTRLGPNSRLICIGDTKQNDLIYKKNDTSGLPAALKVFETIPQVALIKFAREDIIRSDWVKQWIIAREDLDI